MWAEDSLWGPVFVLHHMGPGTKFKQSSFDGKRIYPLRHVTAQIYVLQVVWGQGM